MLPQEAILLYLWQNDHTVVIGRNQNAYREVNVNLLEQDGGYLARRLSGGGAVYHDKGNLNFTFIMPNEEYNTAKQMQVIVKAAVAYGLDACLSGRNDVEVEGKKFSGNAYYHGRRNAYHHGTVLVDTNMEALQKYLNVSKKKMDAKGVRSVRSRVCNLKALNETITVEGMQEKLVQAFGSVYGLEVEPFLLDWVHADKVTAIERRIAADHYRKGLPFDFTLEREEKFPWGMIQVQLQVEKGIIQDIRIYSDAMDVNAVLAIQTDMKGLPFERTVLEKALKTQMGQDILRLF